MTLRKFKVLLEWDPDEKVWVTTVPALNGISTFGDTREEALEDTREAILGYFEALEKEGLPFPQEDQDLDIVELEIAVA